MNLNYLSLQEHWIYVPKEVIMETTMERALEIFCTLYLLDNTYPPRPLTIKQLWAAMHGKTQTMPKERITRCAACLLWLQKLGYIELRDFKSESGGNEFYYKFTKKLCGKEEQFRYGRITVKEYKAVMDMRAKSGEYKVSVETVLRVLLYIALHMYDGRKKKNAPMINGGGFYSIEIVRKLGMTPASVSKVLRYLEDCGVLYILHPKYDPRMAKKGNTLFVAMLRTDDLKKEVEAVKKYCAERMEPEEGEGTNLPCSRERAELF